LFVPSKGPAFAIGAAVPPWSSAGCIPALRSAIFPAASLEGLAGGRNKLCDPLGGGFPGGIAFGGDDLRVDVIGDGLGYRLEDWKLTRNIHVRLSIDDESFNLTRSKKGSNDLANA
jgi:hypothetical protein